MHTQATLSNITRNPVYKAFWRAPMATKDEALKLALKVFEDLPGFRADIDNAITAIKEALEQEQKPFTYYDPFRDAIRPFRSDGDIPLYTTPPQRPWVEPTGNEWSEWWRISKVADATDAEIDFGDFLIIAHAVSAKLKEKNT